MKIQRLFSLLFTTRYKANLGIAMEAVLANRIRSLLTALGIIFGVAAVIAMLAIGRGAQQEILNQIRLVGVNNIVIKPIVKQEEKVVKAEEEDEKQKFSPGLTLRDAEIIRTTLPWVEQISPEITKDTYVLRNGLRRSAKLVGVFNSYFQLYQFDISAGGLFLDEHHQQATAVCIIGQGIRTRFFPTENPLGKSIKIGGNWLVVVGVLADRVAEGESLSKLGIRDVNMDIYIPLQTMLVRFGNRDKVTLSEIREAAMRSRGNRFDEEEIEEKPTNTNYHQLDRLVIQIKDSELLQPTAEVLARMLKRTHYEVVDYEIEIPELLLKQQQRTRDIFNYVLGAIAGISLLVGGIGIMNIMLASVLERIKEIGLRLSLGARKRDIVEQFLFEAMTISVSGGVLGIVLGVTLAYLVSVVAGIPTIITLDAIALSFGVAATVGLLFGIAPARKAAGQDPITSLRYE
jgi:putative ABC transport system permease protein